VERQAKRPPELDRAAIELKTKSIWIVEPNEFLVSVMVELDSAMAQTGAIQMIQHFSQERRGADAECEVVQPGLFLVVRGDDFFSGESKEEFRVCHFVHQGVFALGERSSEERGIEGSRSLQIPDAKNKVIYIELMQYGIHNSILPSGAVALGEV
jgi:hypothetical protein